MSTSEKTAATPKADAPLIENRFALRRKMSTTALADVYWADDLFTPTQGEQDHIVLLILVAPTISNIPGFSKAWSAIMSRPAPPALSYPNILDWGNDGASYWFTCANTQGTLLSEYFNELDKRGLSPDQAFAITETVSHALNNVQAGAFGYFEPGTTLKTDSSYVLLNAPLAKVMHSLLLQQTGVRSPLALHSAWLSPSVAVGDIPVTEDDSFAMASLYQTLMLLLPPYGQQSTLTAVARGTPAAANPKLKPEAQQILSQALSLQRNQRPENPEALLKGLNRKNHRKLLLPIAALAAAGVVVYASYHLISKFNGLLHEPTQVVQTTAKPTPQAIANTVTTEPVMGTKDAATPPSEAVSLVNEAPNKPVEPASPELAPTAQDTVAAPAAMETAKLSTTETEPSTPVVADEVQATTAAPVVALDTQTVAPTTNVEVNAPLASPTETVANASNTEAINRVSATAQAEVTQMILKATDAFNAGNITGTEGTLALLRQVWAIDRQDPNARALLNKVIAQQQQQTENRINLNKTDEAKASLVQTDDLIREFTLTDRIEEQVRLESQIEIREREQREAGDLIQQAKVAIKRGELSKEDGNNNALAHLNKLMFILPNNPEGRALLEEVVQTRQEQIKRNLDRNKLSKAGTYLDETSRLIRKYNLTGQTRTQASLERDYRQATEAVVQARAAEQAAATPTSDLEPSNSTEQFVQQVPVEPATILVPQHAEGERYVTPVDDLTVLNQAAPADPQVIEQQQPVVNGDLIPAQIAEPALQNQAAPRPQRPQPTAVVVEPSQPVAIQEAVPEQNQAASIEQVQPEELPAESVIQVPASAPVAAGIINQGVLDTEGAAAPPTEAEIPDSERR
ncbi:MAG: hypothetical protein WBP46_00085 [Thiolinea sp.]